MPSERGSFLAGLFLTTAAALALEILDTRLLSVMTWYHLSFFAVSTAMFGMAAGGVRVYLGHDAFSGDAAPRALAENATRFALSIPLCTLASLRLPIASGAGMQTAVTTAVASIVLALPFYFSGVVVAIALTRIPARRGLVYAVDLVGAALGSIAVLILFELSSIASAAAVLGMSAAAAAACLHRFARTGRHLRQWALALALLGLGAANEIAGGPIGVVWAKGEYQSRETIEYKYWTIHGQVISKFAKPARPQYWGRGNGTEGYRVERIDMRIDGAAGTSMTRWDGDDASLAWVQHDVTALPYHLRRGGDAAIIGVGGGRDLLTALWASSRSVVGIEINAGFLDLLEGPLRDFGGLADDPRVTLIHDEARSYLTRSAARFDVLQMSLIDTWAATGAGAFTLSENGLYTREAWATFLARLRADGIFSVSRWYSEGKESETSRLLALATASLLDRGVDNPREHMMLVSRFNVATLMISPSPFSAMDIAATERTAARFGFRVLLAPGRPVAQSLLARIADSRSLEALDAAIANPTVDYSPPSDERPYFFNTLRPGRTMFDALSSSERGIVAEGNRVATITLVILWGVTLALVVAVILGPLVRAGLPRMSGSSFALAVTYFALIGAGFMFVQIPLMQRFSVYLGHPTYSVAVILFAMILATGAGSWLSDRIPVDTRPGWLLVGPVLIALNLLLWTTAIQPLIDETIQFGLGTRVSLVVAVVASAALPLGTCFPIGLRLVGGISEDAMPWMWGVNGAVGVLATVTAVAISMWSGISTSLYLAALGYALLCLPASVLGRRARATT